MGISTPGRRPRGWPIKDQIAIFRWPAEQELKEFLGIDKAGRTGCLQSPSEILLCAEQGVHYGSLMSEN